MVQLTPNESTEDLYHIANAPQITDSRNVPTPPQKTALSDANSNASSPTPSNPTTPERHYSIEFDPCFIDAMSHYAQTPKTQEVEEEFPNPYDKLQTPSLTVHARANSAPDLAGIHEAAHSVQRLPSVLRPAHPKTFDTVGSRRATRVFSPTTEFGASPLAFGEWRSSMYCLPTFNTEDNEAHALSQRPYVPRSQSVISWPSQHSLPNMEREALNESLANQDIDNDEETPQAQSDLSDAVEAVGHQPTDETPKKVDSHITRQQTDLWPAKVVAMGNVKPKPKWKFWLKGK